LKTFDELILMSDEDKLTYLRGESEKIIQGAPANNQLKLRALQAKCDGIRNKVKDNFVGANRMYYMMQDSLMELNESLKPFRED